MRNTGKLDSTELRSTIRPPKDKYLPFQPDNFFLKDSIRGFHIVIFLGLPPIGTPRYLNGITPCLQFNIKPFSFANPPPRKFLLVDFFHSWFWSPKPLQEISWCILLSTHFPQLFFQKELCHLQIVNEKPASCLDPPLVLQKVNNNKKKSWY